MRKQAELIDFIGIGAPKAATTWIYECLKEHPEICVSATKEVNFFIGETYERGLQWYTKQFAHCGKENLRGEFSPNYLYSAEAARRIRELFPSAKLIVSLRNPIERFISQFYFEYGIGRHDISDIEKMPEGMKKRLFRKGMYWRHLEEWLELFPRENIHISIYETIEKDPSVFIQNIYSFLGVRDSFVPPSINRRANITAPSRTRFRALKRLYYRSYRAIVRSRFCGILAPLLRATGIPALVKYFFKKTERLGDALQKYADNVPREFRDELRRYFADDISQLERFLNRDLSFWR